MLDGVTLKRIEFEYGYGDQWLYEITKGIVVDQYVIGDNQVPWKFLEDLKSNGIAVVKNVKDVKRKKDLMFN